MITRSVFENYVDEAHEECHRLSFKEKSEGLWTKPAIIDYFVGLPIDDINSYLTVALSSHLPDTYGRQVLVIGGAIGRLGRNIALKYPGINVTEIDSSQNMVSIANKLARVQNLNGRYRSIAADGFNLPCQPGSQDYVIAQGFIRYFSQEEQILLFEEMRRVAKFGLTIGEGKGKEIIYGLHKALRGETKVLETHMEMFNMSLFYMLFRRFERDPAFQRLIQEQAQGNDNMALLAEIAGTSKGIFYELRAR